LGILPLVKRKKIMKTAVLYIRVSTDEQAEKRIFSAAPGRNAA
jgi:hypothetical protein